MKKKKIVCIFLFLLIFLLNACNDTPNPLTTGEHTIISQGVERVFYLKLPEDYSCSVDYPIIFAFHGMGGSYDAFLNQYYNLQDAVGEEAILVYPNALPDDNGTTVWDYGTVDLQFFDDLYERLESSLCIDIKKVFAVGHSNGAVFSHLLGWKRGNVFRAIGPVAGFLFDIRSVKGRVAVIQIHGITDEFIPFEEGWRTRNYWVEINECNGSDNSTGADPYCVEYQGCKSDFPVQFCEHDLENDDNSGHAWPEFAGNAIWNFFKSLPDILPSSEAGKLAEVNGTIDFEVYYPAEFNGTLQLMALGLYHKGGPYDTMPILLNLDIPFGNVTAGESTVYDDININLSGVAYGEYEINLTVWLEGASWIPRPGIDYVAFQDINITDNTTIVLDTPFAIELMTK
ncbi:alpha/beta hydrolase family esterase [Spirochaetota bacterium]